MSHQQYLDIICRICAVQIVAVNNKKRKYVCMDYTEELVKYFKIIHNDHDPKYFCQKCYDYMRLQLIKSNHVSNKFCKRLWQKDCKEGCDTCYVGLENSKGGGHSKKVYQTNCQFDAPHCLLPTSISDPYHFTCGICCNAINPISEVLPCGHAQCKNCAFVSDDGNSAKCSKCTKIYHLNESIDLKTEMMNAIQVMCTSCKKVGNRNEMMYHTCCTKHVSEHLTVKDLLNETSEEVQAAASLISQKWIPRLAENGIFNACSHPGKVSDNK